MTKVDRYKLESTFHNGDVTNTRYTADLLAGLRKTAVKTTWADVKPLGSGGFGTVTLQQEEYGHQLRAVKKVVKGPSGIDNELKVMCKIVDYQEFFVVLDGWYEDEHFYYISMEYIPGGDLSQYIQTPSCAGNACEITRQLLQGVGILHEMKICHRDLKPLNILITSFDPIWLKIADFGASKRFKHATLDTQISSPGYTAPELIGLLPRKSDNKYTEAVDMWALGCVVYEVLTAEIPFMEVAGPVTMTDISESRIMQQDYTALKNFCCKEIEFPIDPLVRSGASDAAIEFLKTVLVADPDIRPRARQALLNNWLSQSGDLQTVGRQLIGDLGHHDIRGKREIQTTMRKEILAGKHLLSSSRIYKSPAAVFRRSTYPPIGRTLHTAKILPIAGARVVQPAGLGQIMGEQEVRMSATGGSSPDELQPKSHAISEAILEARQSGESSMSRIRNSFHPLSGVLNTFRSEMRAAGLGKRELKIRWGLSLSSSYMSIVAKVGTEASLGKVVNVGMLVLRDAVESQYPIGLKLVTKAWVKVLQRVVRDGQSSRVQSQLASCFDTVNELVRDGRRSDARNLIMGGYQLLIQACRVGDQELVDILANVWAKDDSIMRLIGDGVLDTLAAIGQEWVTAIRQRDIAESRALLKAGTELLVACGKTKVTALTSGLSTYFLNSVQQVLNPSDPELQYWVFNHFKGRSISNIVIGGQDEDLARVTVGVGLELLLAMFQLKEWSSDVQPRLALLSTCTKVLEKIALAGHLQSAKIAVENLAKEKFGQFTTGVHDRHRIKLKDNLLEVLQAVSNTGYQIPQLQRTIEDLENSIKGYARFSANQPDGPTLPLV